MLTFKEENKNAQYPSLLLSPEISLKTCLHCLDKQFLVK